MKLKYRKRRYNHVVLELKCPAASTRPQILKDVTIHDNTESSVARHTCEKISMLFQNSDFSFNEEYAESPECESDFNDENETSLVLHKLV